MRMTTKAHTGALISAMTSIFVGLVAACGSDATTNAHVGQDTETNKPPTNEPNDSDQPGTNQPDQGNGLPSVLSLSGCDDLGFGPLCSLTEKSDGFDANCGGKHFAGKIDAKGDLQLSADKTVETSAVSCTGRFANGRLTASCSGTNADGDALTCNVISDRQILPGVACMELPSQLENVALCTGDGSSGSTLQGGTCKVIQDGCIFQAECASDVVFTGTVTRTGVTFSQKLVALADAETPANGDPPAFLKGETVAHACTATLEGVKLSGSCVAGRSGRNGTHTSVCGITGQATSLPPTCGPVTKENELLFALDSCTELRDGAGSEPGIGQPVCAFRQNNCIWEVNCANDPLLTFAGRLAQNSTKLEWRLLTGTPCEATLDASGNVTGKCTVPGETACALKSIPAAPGGESCPTLPVESDFHTNGCGGGSVQCRVALQHKCDFMAMCSFGTRFPDVVIAGSSSYSNGRPHMAFNGLLDYKCAVDKASAEEISSGDREANEWYGQCVNSAGGQCRDTYNPTTKTGFRGLRVYFDDQN
ncbi:MAG TPA: hypothetical protein VM580_21580 [Labilithrix sp.]|nr:hypothetical protein [Labilithrix sp.]